MDHIGILERAVTMTVRHRALWVVGALWALAGGCSGPTYFPNVQYNVGRQEAAPLWLHRAAERLAATELAVLVAGVLAALAVLLILAILSAIVRYVVEAGTYRAVDELVVGDERPRVRGVWRRGWDRRTWRLWFQNLVVGIPIAICAVASLVLVALPLVLLAADQPGLKLLGVLGAMGLFFLWLAVLIAVMVAVGVLKQLWWRAAVVDNRGFLDAIAYGWRLGRRNFSDAAIMWLLMLGATIIYGVFSLAAVVVLVLITGGVAGVPAYMMWQAGRHVLGVVYGLAVGAVTFGLPALVLGGLFLVFKASVWGQFYRQLADREQASS